MTTPPLFTSFRLGLARSVELSNRIVVSPMCQYSAVDGSASDWHVAHLSNLAMSGASLVFVEATAVEARGRITPGDLGLYSDDNERALRRVLDVVRAHGTAKLGIQLAHAGRKASCAAPWDGNAQLSLDNGGWETIAPAPISFKPEERAPRAMTDADRDEVKRAFVASAVRAANLGFDVVELHCAHGYLMHQHLSPVSNPPVSNPNQSPRSPQSLQARMEFPLAVFSAMRDALPPSLPLGARVSSTDWLGADGWLLDDTVAFARELRARGCAFIDCSSGGSSPAQMIPVAPGYQVPFARRVREDAKLPTIAVGMITEPHQANQIIKDGDADLVALARAMLWNPRWGWHAAAELGVQIDAPVQARLGNPKVLRPHVGTFTRTATR